MALLVHELRMPIADANTFGHMIRQDLIKNNTQVLTAYVETADTLDPNTSGRLVVQMLPWSNQSAQAAIRESIQRLVTELDSLLQAAA